MDNEANYWRNKRLNRRQVLRGGLALGAGAVGLSIGCAGGPSASPTPTAAPAAGPTATPSKPKPQGKVTVASLAFAREIIDPLQNYSGAELGWVRHVFDPLVMRDLQGKFVPGIATKWTTPDAQTWTFELRKGVKFHNGDPMTAKDVKATFDRARTIKDGPQAVLFTQYLDSADVVDDYTLRVKLTQRYSPFLTALEAGCFICPKDYFDKVGLEGFMKAPVGTGPFRWVTGKVSESIEMEAVEDHWRTTPNIKTLLLRIVPDIATRAAMLKAREVDIAIDILPAQKKDVEADKSLRVLVNPGTATFFHQFIGASKKEGDKFVPVPGSPWLDKRLRQAVNYAVNNQQIADKLYLGTASAAVTTVLPTEFGFDSTLKPYPYDPDKAKALLKEAGYADGLTTDLNTNQVRAQYTEAVAGFLNAVGIKTNINVLEGVAYNARFSGRQLTGIGSLGHPNMYDGWRPLYHYTMTGPWSATSDPVFDKMIVDIQNEPDDVKREDLLKKAVRRELDEAYNLFGIDYSTLHAVSDRIVDWPIQKGFNQFKWAELIKLKS